MPKILPALFVALAATSAAAGSGQTVTKIESGTVDNPYCTEFKTTNDAKTYGVSEKDPGYQQAFVSINNSRNIGGAITFTIGEPGTPFHASHCGAGVTYVHSVGR